MKKIFEAVRFNIFLYFKSSRFVVPIIANMIFLYVMYYECTYDIGTVLIITGFFSFYLMMFVGNSIISLKNEILEQIVILRIGKYKVSISEFIFVSFLSLLVMIMCCGIPLLFNCIGSGFLIKQHIPVENILCTLIIVWLSGILGGVIGSFFNNSIIKNRKMVTLLIVLIAVLSVSRGAIVAQRQWTKYVLFILPPIDEIRKCIDFFNGIILTGQACLQIFNMIIYILIVCGIKHIICNKRMYD